MKKQIKKKESNERKNKINNALKSLNKNRKLNTYIIIACIAVIMVWRAIRNFCDLYMFPNNEMLSNITCFII